MTTMTTTRYEDMTDAEAADALLAATEEGTGFVYYGDLELGTEWAFCFGQHRDSDALDRSNYRVILADLTARFPNAVQAERFTHWAVGWVDHLCVRLRDEEGDLTDAVDRVAHWKRELEYYPVADERDYSEAESEEFYATVESVWFYGRPADAGKVCDYMNANDTGLGACAPDDPSEDDVKEAAAAVGVVCD